MKFFKRKKTHIEPLPNIREGSSVQHHENTQVFSSAYKNIIQESMDATVAPLLSRDNPDASEPVITNETGNTTEQSMQSYDNTLSQFQSPINLPSSSQIQEETLIQPDTTTLLNQRKNNEILLLIKVFSFIGFVYFVQVWNGWEFLSRVLSSVLLILFGFAGGYLYLLISNIIKGASGTLQEVSREGAEIAQRAYRETIEKSVSLDPCLKAAQKAYSQYCIENNVAPSRLTPSNTDKMHQRICDAFAVALSNEILRVNNHRLERS
ncbi:hypothetical protein DAPPUDRAFT_303195 [Daphnia pulex]|uniref:Uncharacterized protein n=1 Tax=Daphnia pulex TaxID=6669 RepID=E9FTM5_DAPPU|nr:hypothetical protein DAPPUDRAFT_303195 [Daphnia pulex]|eukprot:EFX89390.1 hypothetical protein DAPPUDRAFT_303195 [Daphnia pulex]